MLIPAFKAAGARLRSVASSAGVERTATRRAIRLRGDVDRRGSGFRGPGVDAVVIATRHDSHAALAVRCAARGQARVRREAAGARPPTELAQLDGRPSRGAGGRS